MSNLMIYSNSVSNESKYENPLERFEAFRSEGKQGIIKPNMTAKEIAEVISDKLIKKVKEALEPELQGA